MLPTARYDSKYVGYGNEMVTSTERRVTNSTGYAL